MGDIINHIILIWEEKMTEYQIFNLMYVGFISNAMYFVGMVLLTWLGFRMANNVFNSSDANMAAKVFTSIYCCLLYTSPSPRDKRQSRMPSSA